GPRKIRDLAFSAAHWTCHGETCVLRRNSFGAHEVADDICESAVILTVINFFDDKRKLVAFRSKCRNAAVRSADVTSENHQIFLHVRPSRSNSSSDSLGPQLPAG